MFVLRQAHGDTGRSAGLVVECWVEMNVDPRAIGTVTQSVDDPRAPINRLQRDLRVGDDGLSSREAQRRLVVAGPNVLERRGGRRWPQLVGTQLIHPLALLLELAAVLAFAAGTPGLGVAIVVVVVLNALFAFAQEQQAERAVEALAQYLPQQATVRRDGVRQVIQAIALVPGDLLLLAEGDRVSADARLVRGAVDIDMSTLTGESQPVYRSAEFNDVHGPLFEARELVFSGTACVTGEAEAIVFATGMRTEIGRIAALAQRVVTDSSPLEKQVRRVAWLIAVVAVGAGLAFLPIGWLAAGLPLKDAFSFAIGLIVANVPEGLLPTLTLALAVGVSQLARRGALVKRLSAVETLGSTTVICTDKTGTLTQNRMRAVRVWTPLAEYDLEATDRIDGDSDPLLGLLGRAIAAASTAELSISGSEKSRGEATEVGLLESAKAMGIDVDAARREMNRVKIYRFDPRLRLMSTVDRRSDGGLTLHVKGALEDVLGRSTAIGAAADHAPITDADRAAVGEAADRYAAAGLRVIAVGRRRLPVGAALPERREEIERDVCLLGLVALFDPPRPDVADAVEACHLAGIRIIVVTGDHGLTAAEIARRVGIGGPGATIVTGADLERLSDRELDEVLGTGDELIFARAAPEAKLRIADVLQQQGEIVAMTGDGVNDAPALRHADIGVAMGATGTDVAREAATMVLTDDSFATIVTAVAAGRRVYANIRKFIVYIFAHLTPEAVPFLIFAISGGRIPLPLTVLQILAIDLGTEILPALALGREPAEPGLMERPPRPRSEGVINRQLMFRSWIFLGLIESALVMSGFFVVMSRAGWRPGDDVGSGTALHGDYLVATTMTFAGIVACQIGTVLAARTERASMRTVGWTTNPLVLAGIGLEIVFVAALVYVPFLQDILKTAALGPLELLILAAFPPIVWGADELRRARLRRAVPPPHSN